MKGLRPNRSLLWHTLFAIWCLVTPFSKAKSQGDEEKVTIQGEAPAFKGETVTWWRFTDFVTYQEERIGQSTVNEDGKFRFERERTERTFPSFLRIEGVDARIHIDPGGDYKVKFPRLPEDSAKKVGHMNEVELTFYELPRHDINNLIFDFNRVYDQLIRENSSLIALKSFRGGNYSQRLDEERPLDSSIRKALSEKPSLDTLVDSLKGLVKERYSEVDHPYFNTYQHFAMADFERLTTRSDRRLFNQYLKDEPVHYHNEEYMKFFNQFFKGFLIEPGMRNDPQALKGVVNRTHSLDGLQNFLKKQRFMENPRIRELTAIKGLFELYYRPEFEQKGVRVLLDSLVQAGRYPETRKIAGNLLANFNKTRKGTRVPSFHLPDRDSNMVSLGDLTGNKHIYLNFFSALQAKSKRELKVIEKLQGKYGEHIKFVSISLDEQMEEMQRFLAEHPEYDWTFLHMGEDRDQWAKYNIHSYPVFYLLSPSGEYIKAPAPKPSGRIERKFHQIRIRQQAMEKVDPADD